ncbi:type II toxin-antitoxin system HicB family antitoxin [soil metagenome]
MREYLVVLEEGRDDWSAYSPDLPGCVAAGSTRAETLELMRGAITLHLQALRDSGEDPPPPRLHAAYVAV